jgi:endonuclease YncB( thermonuclease family)
MKKTILTSGVLALILSLWVPALAQEMPSPRRMPRIPVAREHLEDLAEAPPARAVQGPAIIFDGEKMRIGETELRLFGVVPPQLTASFGPQARSTLDALANGQIVNCLIRDRDHDGRLLGTCHSASGNDMALELLRRGLAVSARGSITGTELAAPYLAAEQAAQTQKIGIWSMGAPPAASFTVQTTPAPAVHIEAAPTPAPILTPAPALVIADKIITEKAAPVEKPAEAHIVTLAAPPTDIKSVDRKHAEVSATPSDDVWQTNPSMGFFERYQILIASALMLTTALSIIAALWGQKSRDKRDEIKAVAAALRGELMAARGICIGRIKTITSEDEDRNAIWPRIRTTLYQAYVGRLGLLGAELARQVASIYGQSSDYASLYSPNGSAYDASKKQALENLARHIDEVLPKLASIELSGASPAQLYYQRPHSRYDTAPSMLRSAPATALPNVYKTIGSSTEKPPQPSKPETITGYAEAVEQQPKPQASPAPPAAATPPLKPTALWETVRGFIQNHRNAIAQSPHDEHVSEYAAMIEEDMARYPYNEPFESFDISPQKKSG